MTPEERFRRVDSLLGQAIDLEECARPAFLDRACVDDPDLRREIEALLEASRRAGSFMARPAIDTAARALARDAPPPLAGRTLGPYEVLALLGAGGMGEVYRARDPRLGRDVAIKVLPAHLSRDRSCWPASNARRGRSLPCRIRTSWPFMSSASSTAARTPSGDAWKARRSARVSSAGRWPGGRPWRWPDEIARGAGGGTCEGHRASRFEAGEHLRRLLGWRREDSRFRSGACARPHAPASVAPGATEPGTVLGTTGYMSPEQVRGDDAGAASDIFSFGCVLYEMLCGVAPFSGSTAAETMAAILRDEPPPIAGRVNDLPFSSIGSSRTASRSIRPTGFSRRRTWPLRSRRSAARCPSPLCRRVPRARVPPPG